jgi:AbrB family looped-hinge helix DNA binding protein
MKATILTIDKAGRVVLPKRLREQFRLRPGAEIEVVDAGDHLQLRPIDHGATLVREGRWWVHGGAPDPDAALEDAVRGHRDERLDDLTR